MEAGDLILLRAAQLFFFFEISCLLQCARLPFPFAHVRALSASICLALIFVHACTHAHVYYYSEALIIRSGQSTIQQVLTYEFCTYSMMISLKL